MHLAGEPGERRESIGFFSGGAGSAGFPFEAPTASHSPQSLCMPSGCIYLRHSTHGRHRKKFSYEKLQRAFEQEVSRVKARAWQL